MITTFVSEKVKLPLSDFSGSMQSVMLLRKEGMDA